MRCWSSFYHKWSTTRLMPGFHHSRCRSAVAVSPFRCAEPLYRCRSSVPYLLLPLRVRTEMLETSFRIHRDEVTRTLIGCPPTAERQNRIRSYLLQNGSYGATADGHSNGAIFHVGNVILTALTEFLQNLCDGNGRTATEWWKPGIMYVCIYMCMCCRGKYVS